MMKPDDLEADDAAMYIGPLLSQPRLPNVAADLDGFTVRAWPAELTPELVMVLCRECNRVVFSWEGDFDLGDLARAALGHEC